MKTFLRYTLLVLTALILALFVAAYLPSAVRPIAELAGQDSRFCQLDNATVHFTRHGQGPALVLVHGYACSTYTWRKIIPHIAPRFTVYAIDLPGFGLSSKNPNDDYRLPAQAASLLAFLDAQDIEQATLVGHSMGGIVAAYAAVAAPSRVSGLIMIDPGFSHGGAPAFLQYLFPPFDRLLAKAFYLPSGRKRSLAASFHHPQLVTDDVLRNYLTVAHTPGAIDVMVRMIHTPGPLTYEGLSRRITTPTLLVWGRHDRNNPLTDAYRLHGEIPNSRLVVIDDAGHYVQEEQPARLAHLILHFP